MVNFEKFCIYCKKKLEIRIKRDIHRKKFCSHACRQKYRYEGGEFKWIKNLKKPKGLKDLYSPKNCQHCQKSYIPISGSQKMCKICIPSKYYLRIYQRYKLTFGDYQKLLPSDKICPLCLKNKATNVDHCHKTGKIRGIICTACNQALFVIDDKEIHERCLKYVSI